MGWKGIDVSGKTTDELLDMLVKLESQQPTEFNLDYRKAIRMELFRREVQNINGIPLEVILRNPLLRAEYELAKGGS